MKKNFLLAAVAAFLFSCGNNSEELARHQHDSIAQAQADSTVNANLEAKMLQASEDSAKAAQEKANH